jgi:MFS transporter, DHA1 family, tetracycline resistance protein
MEALTDRKPLTTRATAPLSLLPLMFETCACTIAVMSFVAVIGPIARMLGLAPWQVGAAVTVAGIAWMTLARAWGAASDRFGRRRTLLQGLGGFVVSYAALCAFIITSLHLRPSAWLAFAGIVLLRGLAGAFYAAVPATAAALIADHVLPDKRAGAMATLGAASAAGMVIGPGLAGMLAARDLALPLYVTAIPPIVAFAVLWHVLPRTEHHSSTRANTLKISDPRLRRALVLAFIAMFCVTIAQVTVGFYALDRLHLDTSSAARVAGIALTSVGVALILAQLLVRRLGWPPNRLIRLGAMIAALGFASVMFADSAMLLWAGYFVAAAGMGWVYPSISALAANAVEPHEQGATAGTISAAHGLGMITGPLVGTLVYEAHAGAPYLLIATLLTAAALWPERR